MTTKSEPIHAAVFDIGGVLLDWNPRYLYRKLIPDEDEMERFLAEICTLEWHAGHDLGVPFATSCARLAAVHPQFSELIWAWGRRSEEMVAGPIDGSVEILRELQANGIRCYALTNMETETYPLRLERYDFLRSFDGTVVSSAEGVAKPDPVIFERLLERFRLPAPTTVMIDDNADNVNAARSRGMQAVRFKSPEQLRSWLDGVGLLAGRSE